MGHLRFGAAALTLAACMALPVAVAVEEPFGTVPGWQAAAALLYLGLVPTALATLMLLTVINSAGPGFFSLVNYQVPVWAVIFGAAVWGEEPGPRLALALVLIAAGLAIAQGLVGLRRGGHARG
jgi:drug/metabolite transporter (DMT)-like permease